MGTDTAVAPPPPPGYSAADVVPASGGAPPPPPGYSAADVVPAGPRPTADDLYEPPDNSIGVGAKELWNQVNPIAGVNKALQTGPIDSFNQDASARTGIWNDAKAAFKRGDIATGAAKTLYSAIPRLGPNLARSGDQFAAGETAKGIGSSVGQGVNLAMAAGAGGSGKLKLPGAVSGAMESRAVSMMKRAVADDAAANPVAPPRPPKSVPFFRGIENATDKAGYPLERGESGKMLPRDTQRMTTSLQEPRFTDIEEAEPTPVSEKSPVGGGLGQAAIDATRHKSPWGGGAGIAAHFMGAPKAATAAIAAAPIVYDFLKSPAAQSRMAIKLSAATGISISAAKAKVAALVNTAGQSGSADEIINAHKSGEMSDDEAKAALQKQGWQ